MSTEGAGEDAAPCSHGILAESLGLESLIQRSTDEIPCPLCDRTIVKPQKYGQMRKHLKRFHSNHNFLHQGKRYLLCRLGGCNQSKASHYHCHCGRTLTPRAFAIQHITRCPDNNPLVKREEFESVGWSAMKERVEPALEPRATKNHSVTVKHQKYSIMSMEDLDVGDTIRSSILTETFDVRSLIPLTSGTNVIPCPLCDISIIKPQKPAQMRKHVKRFHLHHSFVHRGKRYLLCRLRGCDQSTNISHYHCHCGQILLPRAIAYRHITGCLDYPRVTTTEFEAENIDPSSELSARIYPTSDLSVSLVEQPSDQGVVLEHVGTPAQIAVLDLAADQKAVFSSSDGAMLDQVDLPPGWSVVSERVDSDSGESAAIEHVNSPSRHYVMDIRSGRGDIVKHVDPGESAALERVIPPADQNVMVQHPASSHCIIDIRHDDVNPQSTTNQNIILDHPDLPSGVYQDALSCNGILPEAVDVRSLIETSPLVVPCPLCDTNIVKPQKSGQMRKHLKRFHLRRSFVFRGKRYMICRRRRCSKLKCVTHYHCHCGRVLAPIALAQRHIQHCPDPSTGYMGDDVPKIKIKKIRAKIKCDICSILITWNNMKRHMKTHANENSLYNRLRRRAIKKKADDLKMRKLHEVAQEMNAQEKTAYWEPCRISGGLRKRSLKYKRKLEKINCAVCSKLIARQNMFRHRKTGCNKSGKKKRGHKKHKANKQYGAEQRLMLDEGYQAENLEYNVEESGSIDYNTKIKPEHIVEFDTMTVWGELIPDHCICQRCQQNRLLSHLITADGIIVDQHFVKTGVRVYCVRCLDCGGVGHYSGITHGLLNHNNHILLTLRFCMWLRRCLQNHITIESEVAKLSGYNGVDYPLSNVILDAYFKFEVLFDHDYMESFTCVECGHNPPILIGDVSKKCCFDLKGGDVEDLSKATDTVNQDQFWQQVTNDLMTGKSTLKPSYDFWAPFVPNGKADVTNTEYMKHPVDQHGLDGSHEHGVDGPPQHALDGSPQRGLDGSPEEDKQEMVHLHEEDMLIHLMTERTMKDIRRVCRDVGVSGNGTKMDCIVRLHKKIRSTDKYRKIFNNVVGTSGGLLALCCPHGVVYGLKYLLRPESSRDYVDILMSLAVQPTLLICDIPASVSAHGNKRMPEMFGPFEGKFLEDTKENIASVSTGALQVSIKELDISQLSHNKQYEDHSYSTTNHPVTGLGFHYCAFDRFYHHQKRPKSDCLHALDIVPECVSINSQVVDELFSSLDDGRHMLTRMSPTQHIFAIRLLCLLRNNILNKKSVALNRPLDEPSSLSVVPGTDERVIVCEEARDVVDEQVACHPEQIEQEIPATIYSDESVQILLRHEAEGEVPENVTTYISKDGQIFQAVTSSNYCESDNVMEVYLTEG